MNEEPFIKVVGECACSDGVLDGECACSDGALDREWTYSDGVLDAYLHFAGMNPREHDEKDPSRYEAEKAGRALRRIFYRKSSAALLPKDVERLFRNPAPHPPKDIERVFRDLVLPLLGRLDHNDQVRSRGCAAQWFDAVLDEVFPTTAKDAAKDAARVVKLIEIGLELCRLHDRLPKKQELWKEARRRDFALFNLGHQSETDLLKLAGLNTLPQDRKGGPKPRPRR